MHGGYPGQRLLGSWDPKEAGKATLAPRGEPVSWTERAQVLKPQKCRVSPYPRGEANTRSELDRMVKEPGGQLEEAWGPTAQACGGR